MEREFSVVDVARALACDTSSIYGFERGRHAISFGHLLALARLLKLDELYLFTLPDANPRHDLIDLTRRAPLRVILSTRQVPAREIEMTAPARFQVSIDDVVE